MLELVNIFIDNALMVSWRLVDLPTTAILVFGVLSYLVIGVGAWVLFRRGRLTRSLLLVGPCICIVVLLVLFALTIDARFLRVGAQMETLNQHVLHMSSTLCDTSLKARSSPQAPLQKRIAELPDTLSLFDRAETELNPAMRLVTLRRSEPRAVLYVTTIDLQNPNVEIVLSTSPTTRTLTSTFARENDVDVAINGEAGQSARRDAGFGPWIGPYVVNGQTIFSETKYKRPTISFRTDRTARFDPSPSEISLSKSDGYNVIWGRLNVLGKEQGNLQNDQSSYPRTMMGIDQQGHRLVLLVADGRQPLHSMGIKYSEAIQVLQAFGVSDAMACDQGGSSTLYIKQLGGVANQPSDGSERPVYTHFGVRYRR